MESDIYISNGVEQYFMPELPHWANFSIQGQCFRKNPIRYINYEKVAKSYNLNYSQLVNLQHMINRKLYAYKYSIGQDQLSPKDESFIFQNSYQRVSGGSSDFVQPKFSKLSLIWIDAILSKPSELKSILEDEKVKAGHPIVISHCATSYELEVLFQSYDLDNKGIKFISAEMFSIFESETKKQPYLSFDFKKYFADKELTFYKPSLDLRPYLKGIKFVNIVTQ